MTECMVYVHRQILQHTVLIYQSIYITFFTSDGDSSRSLTVWTDTMLNLKHGSLENVVHNLYMYKTIIMHAYGKYF